MSFEYRFNITESLRSGIDFYGLPAKQAEIAIQIDSSLTSTASKISFASANLEIDGYIITLGQEVQLGSANISITSDLTVSAKLIELASSSVSGDVSVSVTAQEILLSSSQVSIDSNVVVNAVKVLYGQSTTSGDISTSTSALKIANANSLITPTSSVTTVGTVIKFANIAISITNVNVIVGKEILYASCNIASQCSVLASAIKFAVSDIPDTQEYRTLLVIDDKPLTNHGRTLSSEISQVFIENKNWNNSKNRYYKRSSSAGRNVFSINWRFVPNSRYDTVDKGYARDLFKELASDPDVHVLKMLNHNENGTTPYTETSYNVFIKDYSETLVRRDLNSDIYYWDCNMVLEEA